MKRHSLSCIALLVLTPIFATWGKPVSGWSEYKRADQNFYSPGSVLKANPTVDILNKGYYEEKGDSYFVRPRHKPAPEIYIEVTHDWLEPITPPSMPASLGVAPDVMQIREPQGDVFVALPSAPASYLPATEEMPIPNGSSVKTGTNGSGAVLFGGVNSLRLAPSSEAVVEQTVTSALRTTKIDVKSGAVFSKVGLRPGEKQDFQVHTPFGTAMAKGTDFVCVVLSDRADVWVAQGTVQFDQPNGQTVGTVKANGTGHLQLLRFPVISDANQMLAANAETLTTILNFIPTADLKIKGLRDQMAEGVKLTAQEKKYLSLIKHVPALIKLALVAPPPPPPAPVPAPAPAPPPPQLAIQAHALMTPRVEGETAAKPATTTKTADKPKSKKSKKSKIAKKTEPATDSAPKPAEPATTTEPAAQAATQPSEPISPTPAPPTAEPNAEPNAAPVSKGPHDTVP